MDSKEDVHKKAMMQQEIDIVKKMSHIKHKIAVMSGKGGVGKSTIAVNLAAAFAKKGYKTGIMDADLHGPNVPKMLNLEGTTLASRPEGIVPAETEYGLEVMSVGFLMHSQDTPLIWRGPAKTGVLKQFLADILWGDLDVLIIDDPPGTGDEPLTVLQNIPLDGVVLVTTPQSVVQEDVVKSINMVKGMKIKVIGLIENMSGFICPECKKEVNIFGEGNVEQMAKKLDIPFLGKLPLTAEAAQASDEGTPIVIKDPKSEISVRIQEIVNKIEADVIK